jgi:hypothetical protein
MSNEFRRPPGKLPWHWAVTQPSTTELPVAKPDPELTSRLAEALDYIRLGASLRDVATHLEKVTGKHIDPSTLHKMRKRRRSLHVVAGVSAD